MRGRVLFLVMMIGTGLPLYVPRVMEFLFPFWTDVFRVVFYAFFLLSLFSLVLSVVFRKMWSEVAQEADDARERVEVDTVTHVRCSFCGFEFRRAWRRGDFVGKVDKECSLCHCNFRVKAIYVVEPKPGKTKSR
jgi:hypothetical protein